MKKKEEIIIQKIEKKASFILNMEYNGLIFGNKSFHSNDQHFKLFLRVLILKI